MPGNRAEDYYIDFCTACADCFNQTSPWPDDYGSCYYNKDLYLRIDFPDPDPNKPGTHWRLGLRSEGLKGLRIVDVAVKAAQLTERKYVIKDAGLADIFVPYDNGIFEPYDMQWTTPNNMDVIDTADLPAQFSSTLHLRNKTASGYADDIVPRVGVECRESGIALLCKDPKNPTNDVRRRLHEVVIWGSRTAAATTTSSNIDSGRTEVSDSANGATGHDNIKLPLASHVHNGLWRVGTKLFDRNDNEVRRFEHVLASDGRSATDTDPPPLVGTEQSLMWNPLQFTNVIVRSTSQTNTYGHLMGYEFTPWNRTGTARHSNVPSDKQIWTLADFYVTNENPGEDGSGSGSDNWKFTWYSPDDYMLRYANRGDPVGKAGSDGVAFWYISSAHHEPSDIDNAIGSGGHTGSTPVHWSGFDMEPHDLFDYKPLGGPECPQQQKRQPDGWLTAAAAMTGLEWLAA